MSCWIALRIDNSFKSLPKLNYVILAQANEPEKVCEKEIK